MSHDKDLLLKLNLKLTESLDAPMATSGRGTGTRKG